MNLTSWQPIACAGLMLAWCCGLNAQQSQPAYNSYLAAPFVVDGKDALAADLVSYLNAKLKGKFKLELENLPRERLNKRVLSDPNFHGVVLFLNPAFVDDLDKTRFAWTQPVMSDGNDVVSPINRKVEYSGPDALKGMLFQGMRGHKYAGLEERFGKDITRSDTNTELQLLQIIAAERADVAIVPSSMFNYLLKTHGVSGGLEGKIYASATQHLKFDRLMFTAVGNTTLHQELTAVVKDMSTDPVWKTVLAKYGLK